MHIKILQETDAQSNQDLRLSGLRTNSDAFGSTFDREDKFSLENSKGIVGLEQIKLIVKLKGY